MKNEFLVNSGKSTKLNATKLAAEFDVGGDLGRTRRAAGHVCVFETP